MILAKTLYFSPWTRIHIILSKEIVSICLKLFDKLRANNKSDIADEFKYYSSELVEGQIKNPLKLAGF